MYLLTLYFIELPSTSKTPVSLPRSPSNLIAVEKRLSFNSNAGSEYEFESEFEYSQPDMKYVEEGGYVRVVLLSTESSIVVDDDTVYRDAVALREATRSVKRKR